MIRRWVAQHRQTIFHWGMEVVIVVIGILIAFALQGWAQDTSDRRRAADAERRIRPEIFPTANGLVERIAIYPCLRAKVAELSRALVAGDPQWRPTLAGPGLGQTVLASVYPVPNRPWSDDMYKSALGSGALASIDPERSAALASLYNSSARLAALSIEENARADELQPLQLINRLSQQERYKMLEAVARLDSINGLARLIAVQNLRRLGREAYRLSPAEIATYRATTWPEHLKYDRDRYGPCVDARAIDAFEPAILAGQSRPARAR